MDRSDSSDLALLSDAAEEAGALAMRYFRREPHAWHKHGGSPVTEADMAVDSYLQDRLLAARPDYGWLSEETADDPVRRSQRRTFIVDPIDGTRGFIAGDERWCVSVAVVEAGRPVTAALFAPALGKLYVAAAGEGAWLGERRLRVSRTQLLAKSRLAGPKSWFRSEPLSALSERRGPYLPSLAYRFALVAEGRLDAAFARPRSQDWDLAACDLLVHEAGGRLTGLEGTPPVYNRSSLRHGVLAAGNAVLQAALLEALAPVAAERQETGEGN
jgi:myo-inositol-1(or 4)-monophosphatase